MFTNSFSNSHGSSLIAAAAIAVAAIAGLAGTASASIIYQDSFTGGTANLDGAAPTVDHGTSTVWTAGGTNGSGDGAGAGVGWQDNGSTSFSGNSGSAYLLFTPSSGNIYTLTASFELTTSSSNWLSVGFVRTPNTTMPLYGSGAYAWGFVMPSGAGATYPGPDQTVAGTGFTGNAYNNLNTLSIVLNTQASAWTYQMSANGTAVTPVVAYTTNPAITAVGLGNSDATGHFSNFELSSAAVPEPASLGLVAAGSLGLLLIKRRRAV